MYNSKYKLIFQILTGLIKNQENKLNDWNINYDNKMKLTDFINKQEQQTIIFFLNESRNKIYINTNKKLQVNYSSLKIIKSQNMLNLKQNIIGIINTKIISSSNKEKILTLLIKETMQILQKYSLLSDEITINKYKIIIFNEICDFPLKIEDKIKQRIVTSIV